MTPKKNKKKSSSRIFSWAQRICLLILQMFFPIETSLATRDTNPGSGGETTPQKCLVFRIQKKVVTAGKIHILCMVQLIRQINSIENPNVVYSPFLYQWAE